MRIGRRSASADTLLARWGVRHAGFVTAWNPLSQRHPAGWNRRRQAALGAFVRRLPFLQGEGAAASPLARRAPERGWSEEHFLIGADPRRLCVLARRFRQSAIVVIRRGGRASLRLLTFDA